MSVANMKLLGLLRQVDFLNEEKKNVRRIYMVFMASYTTKALCYLVFNWLIVNGRIRD